SWLSVSPTFGTVGTDGVIVKLTVNETAVGLSPRVYRPGVAFTNVTNGRGSTTRSAMLTVRALGPPSPNQGPTTGTIGHRGYLHDEGGGYLVDEKGRRLMGQ